MKRMQALLRLSDLVGASPLNPRSDDVGDLEGLKASILANGLLQPILVQKSRLSDSDYLALDGSRRLAALHDLADSGAMQTDAEIAVVIVDGTEAEMREIALAANVHRLDLHPVEKFEAFAGLTAAGMNVDEIAAHFHIEPLEVKRALALGRLSPIVRIAWKEGRISGEAAQAFTASPDHARQAEIFGRLSEADLKAPAAIRRLLRGDAVAATAPIARFAGQEYIAAGGAVDESLFEEHSHFLDGALLRQVATEKLTRLGEEIRAREGWKWALTEELADSEGQFIQGGSPDYLDEESERLEEIEYNDASSEALAERDAIDARAWLRGVPSDIRATLGIVVDFDYDGRLMVDRGLKRREEIPDELTPRGKTAPEASDGQGGRATPSASPAADEPKKAVRDVIDATVTRAFADCVSGNVNLALAFAVASIGARVHSQICALYGAVDEEAASHDLLDQISDMKFVDAFAHCVGAPLADLTAAFAALVARSVKARYVAIEDLGAVAREVATISALGPALVRAFEPTAYFSVATKEAALSAIRELQGEAATVEAGKLARNKIADQAARIARDKSWLPYPLSSWSTLTPRERTPPAAASAKAENLAQAMAQAIEADEGGDVRAFLDERTEKADGQNVRATELHEAFVEWCVEHRRDPIGIGRFGELVVDAGLTRWRHKTGRFYVGLRLRAPVRQAAE